MKARLRGALAAGAFVGLVGCEAVAPALTSLAMSFGQDLLAAASVNHAPRYAVQVENLLTALASRATGLEMAPQLAQAGYQAPPPDYLRNQGEQGYEVAGGGYDYPQQQPSTGVPDQGYPSEDYPADTYPTTDYPTADYPSQTYPTAGYPEQGYPPAESYPREGYPPQTYPDSGSADGGYPSEGSTADQGGPIVLTTTLLTRRADSPTYRQVSDGDTLRDGDGNPADGDLLKVHFRANCACYVAVVGIDATGYVARIWPESGTVGRVSPFEDVVTPGGSDFWALDDQAGVEHVYFIASRQPLAEIDSIIEQLERQPRLLASGETYVPVTQPALPPATRGLVKVSVPDAVNVAGQRLDSNSWQAGDSTRDLVLARWFNHE